MRDMLLITDTILKLVLKILYSQQSDVKLKLPFGSFFYFIKKKSLFLLLKHLANISLLSALT